MRAPTKPTIVIPVVSMTDLVFGSEGQPANDTEAVPEAIDPESTPPYPFFRLDLEDEVGESELLSILDRIEVG